MDALRTPDDRFADLPGYPFAPHYVDIPDGDGGTLRVHHLDEGRPRRAGRAPAPRRAVVELPLPPHDPGARRRRAPGRRARPRRLRSLRQAGRAHRLHLRPPRRLAQRPRVRRPRPAATSPSSARTGAGCSACGSSPRSPTASPRVVAANTFLPTGDGKPGDAFLAWQKFSQEVPEMPDRAPSSTAAAPPTSPARSSPPTTPRSRTRPTRRAPGSSRCSCPPRPTTPSRRANRAAWEVLAAFDRPFLCAFSDEDPITAGNERHLISRIAGAAGPAPHDHRGRRPLPPGGPRPRSWPRS